MPKRRPNESDVLIDWKLQLPATLAGKLEHLFMDRIHNKPKYGARARLTVALYEWWIAREAGDGRELPHVPTLAEIRTGKLS